MKTHFAYIVIILGLIIAYLFINQRKEYDQNIKDLYSKVDSLETSYSNRESRVDTLKIKEKTIYKTYITKEKATETILGHELERFGTDSDTLPHCDTLVKNYAKTVNHLNNTIEQRNQLDTALQECKEAGVVKDEIDSEKDEEIKNLKKKRFKLFGKGFSIGFGAGVVSSAVARNR